MGAVFLYMFYCFCSHIETGGVCKCASAIRTMNGVGGFFLRTSSRLLWTCFSNFGPFETRPAGKLRTDFILLRNGARGPIKLGRTGSLVCSSSPRPSYALTPCPHQLTYALLFIQAVRYNFWGMGAQLQQEGCYDLDKVTEKKIYIYIPKLRLGKPVFSHLLYITIFLYYLSELKKKKICKWMKEIHKTYRVNVLDENQSFFFLIEF